MEKISKIFKPQNSFMSRFSIFILYFVMYPNCRSSRRKFIQICYKPDMKLKKCEDPPILKKSNNFGKQSWKLAKFGHCFVKSFLHVIMTCDKLHRMFGEHLKSIIFPPDDAGGHLKLLGKLLHFHKSNFFFVP